MHPTQYSRVEVLPSLFDEGVEFRTSEGKARNEDYVAFIEKFKPKLTTDDCMTPPAVYDAVLEWTCGRCGIDPERTRIIRPFKPGGDYLAEDYSGDCAVIDNPPFSILSGIVRNYLRMGVRFLLFAPHLTMFNIRQDMTRIVTGNSLTYANGAKVSTGFVSNMFGDVAVMTAPDLARAVKAADMDMAKVSLPKYSYPDELVTASRLAKVAMYEGFSLTRDEVCYVSSLDSMRAAGKVVYGGAFLMSEEKAAELRAAELRAAELRAAHRWDLSERERATVDGLGRGG